MSITPLPKPSRPEKRKSSPLKRSRLARGTKRIKTYRPAGTKRMEAKAAGYVDPLTWLAVVEWYRGLCAYCEERAWEQVDHVYPITKGGPDLVENIVPSCARCNAEKGTSTRWQPKRVHPFITLVDYRKAKR